MTNKAHHSETLGWEVNEVFPTFSHNGTEHPLQGKVLVNSETSQQISVMGEKYNVLTNKQFVELAEMAAEQFNLQISHYTTIGSGKRVLVAFKRSDKPFKIGQWEVENHLVFINSHDGTKGFEIGSSNGLYRCANMFASTTINTKIYHNSAMQDAIDELKMRIMGVDEILEQEFAVLNRWQNVKISPKIIQDAKEQLFNLGGKELSTAMTNKLLRFDASVDQEIGQLGHNLFGLHNAVTHFTTHNYQAKENSSLEWGKDFPLWGGRANLNAKAFQICSNIEKELVTA